MCFSDKVYDVLKWIATLLLPGLGTLYFSLASIWGLPYAEQVIGTITAVDTLLGILLGISMANYKGDGMLTIYTGIADEGEAPEMHLDTQTAIEELAKKSSATFKVETVSG